MKLNVKALADVEIGLPVIAEGLYHARFNKPEVKENKSKDGNNLVVQVTILDNPIMLAVDGKQIENKGRAKYTRHISLKPTPDYDPDEKVKEIAVAIKHPPEADLSIDDIEGKLIMVKLSVREEREDPVTKKKYPRSNEIDRFSPVSADDTFVPPPF